MPAKTQSIAALIPVLQWLAGAGSGIVAYWLFDQARDRIEVDSPLGFLHAPFYARLSVMVFTFLVGTGASVLLAFLTGADVPSVLDASVAGFLSLVAAQVTHGYNDLPREPRTVYLYEDEDGDETSTITPSA